MITDGVEQRSISWFRSRVGFLTGSKIADIMKSGRKKDEIFSETAKAYLFQVAGERLFNPTFLNDDGIFQDYLDLISVSTKAMSPARWQFWRKADLSPASPPQRTSGSCVCTQRKKRWRCCPGFCPSWTPGRNASPPVFPRRKWIFSRSCSPG